MSELKKPTEEDLAWEAIEEDSYRSEIGTVEQKALILFSVQLIKEEMKALEELATELIDRKERLNKAINTTVEMIRLI